MVSPAAQKWEIKAVKAGDELNDPMRIVSLQKCQDGPHTCNVIPVLRYLCLISCSQFLSAACGCLNQPSDRHVLIVWVSNYEC